MNFVVRLEYQTPSQRCVFASFLSGGFTTIELLINKIVTSNHSHIQEAWHSFIDAKCRPWPHKSDTNPPEGDTKPPGDNN